MNTFNDPDFFWKNFRLGSELHISGTFLYNALYFFDKMEHFVYEAECFEFLYNTAVGIERLEKIAVILFEHSEKLNQNEFEETLLTHNHVDLFKRIKLYRNLKLGKTHSRFLQLLSDFYKSSRYDRFNLSSVYHPDQDQARFVDFVSKELNISINIDMMFPTPIDHQIKAFVCKTVSSIALEIYDIINDRASELNLYTYEIAYKSKAYKIFIEREYLFEREKLFQKEILVHLLNSEIDDDSYEFIKSIKPIPLESHGIIEYVKFLIDFHKNRELLDELDYIYEENKFDKKRSEALEFLGSNATFDFIEDEE